MSRAGTPLTLAYLDLDNFKQVNDRGGHSAGDRALILVAGALAAAVRRSDVVARIDGDEFVPLMQGIDHDGAIQVLAKVRLALSRAFEGEPFALTCSIGAVVFAGARPSVDEALRAVDRQLYSVKRHGKDSVAIAVFEPSPSPSSPIVRKGSPD